MTSTSSRRAGGKAARVGVGVSAGVAAVTLSLGPGGGLAPAGASTPASPAPAAGAAPAAVSAYDVRPGQSIQRAIERAKPGATIRLAPGTYRENLELRKDGLRLVGRHATLVPPKHARATPCDSPGHRTGICVHGRPGAPVKDVTLRGLTVRGFTGDGVRALGALRFTATGNTFADNGGYGLFALRSERMTLLRNTAKGNNEAGLYVGESPKANMLVVGNRSVANKPEGLLIRDALGGLVAGNDFSRNCAGVIVLNVGSLGPDTKAGNVVIAGNRVQRNNAVCPSAEGRPPLSGSGISLVGDVRGVTLAANAVTGNRPGDPASALQGGILLVPFPGTTNEPTGNRVQANEIRRNSPVDLQVSAPGNNVVAANRCATSTPARLCAS